MPRQRKRKKKKPKAAVKNKICVVTFLVTGKVDSYMDIPQKAFKKLGYQLIDDLVEGKITGIVAIAIAEAHQ